MNTMKSGASDRGGRRTSAGHLSVHIEGAHPLEVPFRFEIQLERLGPAFIIAFAYHVSIIVLVILAMRHRPEATEVAKLPAKANGDIIWLSEPGPGGGGGGGGNQKKEPPRQVEQPGEDKITVPVVEPRTLEAPKEQQVQPDPVVQPIIPVLAQAAALESLAGVIEPPLGPPTASQGSGVGGGSGTGSDIGIGPGAGQGLGPGSRDGTGGQEYRPGGGVTIPRVLRVVRPAYTSDAMRARVQGAVLLHCVVRPDGSITDIEVVRSLDPVFGLDQEAIKAARQWRFAPGTRFGEPVSVAVTIELTFALR